MGKHNSRLGRQLEDGKSVVVHESAPGGMRKIRTPDHQIATPIRQKDGSTVYRSPNGRTYKSKPMK